MTKNSRGRGKAGGRGARTMKMSLGACARWIILSLGILLAPLAAASSEAADDEPSPPTAATHPPSKLRSADDGWLDLSGSLDESYGFVPLVIPTGFGR